MQDWADYLDRLKAGVEVIPLRQRAWRFVTNGFDSQFPRNCLSPPTPFKCVGKLFPRTSPLRLIGMETLFIQPILLFYADAVAKILKKAIKI